MEMRIVLVDDHEVFREGLRTIVEAAPGHRVVAESGAANEAATAIERLEFDLLITDLLLPGSSGLALIREMRRRGRREPVLLLTMHASVDVASEALRAGAKGYALKSDASAVLLTAIDDVASGKRFASPQLPQDAIESFLNESRSPSIGPLGQLSVREREIFDLLVRGYDNDDIGAELFISPKTVETHRGHIFGKLRVHSMVDLVRFAFRHQLLHAAESPPPPRAASNARHHRA